MKNIIVHQIDAFTQMKGQGNPAGVIVNGDLYNTHQMQEIAKKIGFREAYW